jgi:hypothetical protein
MKGVDTMLVYQEENKQQEEIKNILAYYTTIAYYTTYTEDNDK